MPGKQKEKRSEMLYNKERLIILVVVFLVLVLVILVFVVVLAFILFLLLFLLLSLVHILAGSHERSDRMSLVAINNRIVGTGLVVVPVTLSRVGARSSLGVEAFNLDIGKRSVVVAALLNIRVVPVDRSARPGHRTLCVTLLTTGPERKLNSRGSLGEHEVLGGGVPGILLVQASTHLAIYPPLNLVGVNLILDVGEENESSNNTSTTAGLEASLDIAIPHVDGGRQESTDTVLGHGKKNIVLEDNRLTLGDPVGLVRVTQVLADIDNPIERVHLHLAILANGSRDTRVEREGHGRVATTKAVCANTAFTVGCDMSDLKRLGNLPR
ncbi:hypothetical protein HG531_007599 [Fusarium graminearum]|nr:hypothetical protein HG531_007599 [Fusarium graminearum]